MRLLHFSKILLTPDRQRQIFDPITLGELSQTILNKGLMHALLVRDTPEGPVLVAGERRLKAIQDMWMLGGTLRYDGQLVEEGYLPTTTVGEVDDLAAEEAELEENLHREPLTWQESAAATSKIHRIRSTRAQREGRIHTVADTAMETKGRSDGSYQNSVRTDLIVAKHLHNPEVAKAKTAEEAFKILKKQEQITKNIALATSVGKTFTKSLHEIHNVNCLAFMSACPPGTFDVILTDPPYGMGADTFGDGGGGRLANNEHHYKDDYDGWKSLMSSWCPLSFHVAKPQAHAYVFCDFANFPELALMMKAAGWYVFRTPFICTKPNSGRVPLPDEGPRRQWECLLYAIKGHKKTNSIQPDVITTTADLGLQHGAQKPVALFENLLSRSVRAGDVVLDSFAGSGTIFPAAHTFKVRAVGCEMNPEYYAICLKRIEAIDTLPPLTDGMKLVDELKSLMAAA